MLKNWLNIWAFLITAIIGIIALMESFPALSIYIVVITFILFLFYTVNLVLSVKKNGHSFLNTKYYVNSTIFLLLSTVFLVYFIHTKDNNKILIGPPLYTEPAINENQIKENETTPEGKFRLGYAYYTGLNNMIEPNYAEAFKWFESAAKDNYELARYYLGEMYYFGKGIDKRPVTAFPLFKQAAENGVEEAQLMLFQMYFMESIEKDGKNLLEIDFEKAKSIGIPLAEKGNVAAQEKLGLLYFIEQNTDSCKYWYKQAAIQGNIEAMRHLSFGSGYSFEEDINDPELARYGEKSRTAVKWARELVKHDPVEGYYNLGFQHLSTSFGGRGFPEGIKYLEQAAELDNPNAQYFLAEFYGFNPDFPEVIDLEKAIKWCYKAAQFNHKNAIELLPQLVYRRDNPDSPKEIVFKDGKYHIGRSAY